MRGPRRRAAAAAARGCRSLTSPGRWRASRRSRALRQLHADLTQQNRTVPSQGPFFKTLGEGADVPAHLRWAGSSGSSTAGGGSARPTRWWTKCGRRRRRTTSRVPTSARRRWRPSTRYHFQQHYGVEHMVAESAHNLVDACKRYAYDAVRTAATSATAASSTPPPPPPPPPQDMALFLEVLHGRADEREHDEQVVLLQHLREAILEADKDHYGMKAENKIPRDVLHARSSRRPPPKASPRSAPRLTARTTPSLGSSCRRRRAPAAAV